MTESGELGDLLRDAHRAVNELDRLRAENERLREVVRLVVNDDTVILNDGGYLVVLMTDDLYRSSTIVDLTPEQFAAVKRALSGSSGDAEAVAYAESHPEGHGPYNGWCRVAGIPLRAEDCPRCQAAR